MDNKQLHHSEQCIGVNDVARRQFLSGLALGAGAGLAMSLAISPLANATNRTTGTRIVVTAPTGNIGSQVLTNLLTSSSDAKIRVIVRDPSRLPAQVLDQVEVIQGSHSDASIMDQALEGASSLFWLCPPDSRAESVMSAYVDFTRPACEAIKRNGLGSVVSISALGRGTPMAANAGYITASLAMDDLIASTGVAFRALTMPSFMDNIARQASSIHEQGRFFLPIDGDLKLPAVATRDIASVATGLLLDPTWRSQEEVPVLGPEDLSFNEMARIMSDVLDKPVIYEQVSFETYKTGFVQRGMSDAMAQGLTDMAKAKNEGIDNALNRTPENSMPTSFRQWCEEELRPLILV